MDRIKLNQADRAFFTLVSEAIFANPFGQKRQDLDRRILGVSQGARPVHTVAKVVERVTKKLAALDQGQIRRLQDFSEPDQAILSNVFLFHIFHGCIDPFDALIDAQAGQGCEGRVVDFADPVIRQLTQRGFTQELACRYFSLFYQIRRAYFFIDRGLLGVSPSMRQLRENLWNHIFTSDVRLYETSLWNRMEDFSTLLIGPTGSGKGAAAAAIGRSGFIPFDAKKKCFAASFTDTFVSVNLTQYAETLLESELFGHTKGSFTGAVAAHDGLLSLCGRHGSIFLDEIGDISPSIQIKLLKVLEERSFTPVGSHQVERFHGRVIAATHQPLDVLRKQGTFRDDFYYRLCSDCIELPSLCQRVQESPGELDILIAHTVTWITGQRHDALCRTVRGVIDRRLGADYAWPGNVRELAQCVRRVIIKQDYQGDFASQTRVSGGETLADQMRAGSLRAEDLVARYCKMLYQRLGTYEEVARRTDLDRRTVKRYVAM
ncbi:MAG: sigma 54-interacting transcriptional regulator [Phycisphaerae bacterium]|nr:sigma 54-interacting transcriptional regulator [Phycisphaerae bacterium]